MKEIKSTSKSYSPRPFGMEELEFSIKSISSPLDTKRTICNVLKMAFNCMDEESSNLKAARSLVLEAFWMAKRMDAKLTKAKKNQLDKEIHADNQSSYCLSLDSTKLPAKGNWD